METPISFPLIICKTIFFSLNKWNLLGKAVLIVTFPHHYNGINVKCLFIVNNRKTERDLIYFKQLDISIIAIDTKGESRTLDHGKLEIIM